MPFLTCKRLSPLSSHFTLNNKFICALTTIPKRSRISHCPKIKLAGTTARTAAATPEIESLPRTIVSASLWRPVSAVSTGDNTR